MENLRFNLNQLLSERKISKNRLCLACCMERTQLNRICSNQATRIDLDTLSRLCTYLNCTPNDIIFFSAAPISSEC